MSEATARTVGVGTVSLDTIESAAGSARGVLGGSAPYFGAAARLFGPVSLVGVTGDDFPEEALLSLADAGIDVSGIRRLPGETFRWHARYLPDGSRETISANRETALKSKPEMPGALRDPDALFLGSTDPAAQAAVLDRAGTPRITVLDTMSHWIRDRRADLQRLIARADVLLLNEEELTLLGGEGDAVAAASTVHELGCPWVVVKRGAAGAVAYGPDRHVRVSAAAADRTLDPTGAGDAFAGGFVGVLAGASLARTALAEAMAAGSAMGSFAVESYSVDRLLTVSPSDVDVRLGAVDVSWRPTAADPGARRPWEILRNTRPSTTGC